MALGSVVGVIPQKPLTIFPPFKWMSAGRVYDAYLTNSWCRSPPCLTHQLIALCPKKRGVGQVKDGQLPRSN